VGSEKDAMSLIGEYIHSWLAQNSVLGNKKDAGKMESRINEIEN
jgi:hypothetical protein